MQSLRLIFLFLILNSLFITAHATITIDSLQVTPSTCPNNGRAIIFVSSTSNSALFLYNIISGPVVYPLQNDSFFNSLYPGTYTVRVHDLNSYDSASTTFTITGTYQPLAFTPLPIAPLCGGGYTSEIIANPKGSGLAPYTWQITSPYVGAPQASDTLDSLAAGTYIVKITDACVNALTKGVVVDSGGSGLYIVQQDIILTGCGIATYDATIELTPAFKNFPLKFTITTRIGTVVNYVMPTPTTSNGLYTVHENLENVNFGQPLHICISDSCGLTYCLPGDTVDPFSFYLVNLVTGKNCVSGYAGLPQFNPLNFIDSNDILVNPYEIPLSFTVTDSITGLVVDSFRNTLHSIDTCEFGCPPLVPEIGGRSYLLTVKDNCGDVFSTMVLWPSAPSVNVKVLPSDGGCVDSTGSAAFRWTGFGSELMIQILSGPNYVRSSKPGFSYTDTIIYPLAFSGIPTGGFYEIGGLPAGNYIYEVSDLCGNVFIDSFIIEIVSSLDADFMFTRNCDGLNSISVFIGNGEALNNLLIDNANYGWILPSIRTNSDATFSALGSGAQVIAIKFVQPWNIAIPGLPSCWGRIDTINIPPINDSILAATYLATCNGTIYIRLDADTFNGVLPFKYEIIHGPETYPPQASNLFTVSHYGTYTVGIVDSCGNVDARQVSVDTGRFTPVVRSGGWCKGSSVQLAETASPFYSYLWHKPDDTYYTGDTLVINSFTDADTGVYRVTKYVNINGCTDSAFGSYHLVFRDTFQQSVSICPGDTLFVGPYIHTTTGIYADTLNGVDGCDSIEVSTLDIYTASSPPFVAAICRGSSYLFKGLELTVAGSYKDTLQTINGCDSIVTLVLGVYPVDSTSFSTSLCTGSSYAFFGSDISIAGDYSHILQNINGCDSVVTLHLTVSPIVSSEYSAAICPDDSLPFHGIQLTARGDYTDTLQSLGGCDSVITLHLSVYPRVPDSITAASDIFCTNDSTELCAPIGFTSYQWSGGIAGTGYCVYAKQAGDYYVMATDSNGCTAESNHLSVSVYPVPSVSIVVLGDTLTSFGQVSYQWILNDTLIQGATGQIYIAHQRGSYSVEVTDTNGCTTVSNPVFVTGVNDLTEGENISVYPNPSTGNWQLTVDNSLVGSTLEVYDEQGRIVFQSKISLLKSKIDLGVASGVYYLRISNDKVTVVRKLVKL